MGARQRTISSVVHTISKGTTNKLYYDAADAAPQGVYLSIKDMLTEVLSLGYFASALYGWASQKDKQIATGQMVNIKRVLGVPFAHGTADLIQGETADEQPLDGPCFGQVHMIFIVQW
ncbi:hypothetical protein WJX77_006515 [Trebouxia sp. C0004]